jgi:hypothetical protein
MGRVGITLLDDGTAVATWVELGKASSEFRARLIDPSGSRSAPMTVATVGSGRGSGFPRVVRRGEELVFAWSASKAAGSEPGPLQVHTAVANLP